MTDISDRAGDRAGPDRRKVLEMGAAAAGLTVASAPAGAATAQSEIVRMDARSLGRAIAARKLSSVEVMNATLDHIAALKTCFLRRTVAHDIADEETLHFFRHAELRR